MEWNNTANSCDDFDKCAENLFCGNLVCNNTNPGFTCVKLMSAVQFHVQMVLNLTKLSMPGLILMSVQNSKTYAVNKSVRTLVEAM